MLGLVSLLAATGAQPDGGTVVHLLGSPYVSRPSGSWTVAEGSNRLLAFLALHRRRVERRYVAGCLWPDVDDVRAGGNLRSALWRLNAFDVPLVRTEQSAIRLHEDVQVDVQLLGTWAARVIAGAQEPHDLAFCPWELDCTDVLPGWDDEWVQLERERVRQRLLHALESVTRELIRQNRCAEAVDVALVAVRADPLRESGQRVLIEAHLAEGNWAAASASLARFRALLAAELGVQPSPGLVALVLPRQAPATRNGCGHALSRG